MDLKKLKEFINLAKEEGVSELKYETKEMKVSVNFSTQSTGQLLHQPVQAVTHVPSSEPANKSQADKVDYHEIKSPFVGTFYTSSSPDKAPYVQVGDRVSKGQTLCILEAMKIMNEIESDIAGEIIEVCVDNESLVEFGQTLFKIK
jgi:acetyl-CoA carboxylase biotin carboxyl carrier protein